ncbi:hypothetical protein HP439_08685 [Sphingobacterium shayense]|uniref:hypothetical protein n=1 Tax=Sphingobacterium shayense TaxID=626343 RepID=UPI0015554EC2|nr:hypothetical protein [Sphingobacterium shayense]NQD70791.1 hypothetical protein [Sphingobacterium shayense]
MEQLLKLLTANKMLNEPINKFTLLIDEDGSEHGALFFIEIGSRKYKIMIPSPHHKSLVENGSPTAKRIVDHKEAMLLK